MAVIGTNRLAGRGWEAQSCRSMTEPGLLPVAIKHFILGVVGLILLALGFHASKKKKKK